MYGSGVEDDEVEEQSREVDSRDELGEGSGAGDIAGAIVRRWAKSLSCADK